MLDVDLARFLCACGLEPTAEAMVVARRLWEVGHLVVDADHGHPSLARWNEAVAEAFRRGQMPSPKMPLLKVVEIRRKKKEGGRERARRILGRRGGAAGAD